MQGPVQEMILRISYACRAVRAQKHIWMQAGFMFLVAQGRIWLNRLQGLLELCVHLQAVV